MKFGATYVRGIKERCSCIGRLEEQQEFAVVSTEMLLQQGGVTPESTVGASIMEKVGNLVAG